LAPCSASAAGNSTAAAKTRLPAGTLIPRRASLAVSAEGAGATAGVFATGLPVTAVQILIRRARPPVSARRIVGAIGVEVVPIGLIQISVIPVQVVRVDVIAVNLILVEVVPVDLILIEGIPVHVARVDVGPVDVRPIHVVHIHVVSVVVVAAVDEGVTVGDIDVPVVRHAAAMPAAAPTIPSPTV